MIFMITCIQFVRKYLNPIKLLKVNLSVGAMESLHVLDYVRNYKKVNIFTHYAGHFW